MLKISDLKLAVAEIQDETNDLYEKCAKRLGCNVSELSDLYIVKKSVDARRKEIYFLYQVLVNCSNAKVLNKKHKQVSFGELPRKPQYAHGVLALKHRPIVVGFGPAGMFAGLVLAQNGYCPLILERGQDVDTRTKQVETFWKTGKLDPKSNVQFGEGGAGTFSDGKLTARSKDPLMIHILLELVKHGAPQDILYETHAHIGTDLLKCIVKSIREEIISLGGDIKFDSCVTDIIVEDEKVKALQVNHEEWIACDQVIYAIGHSARDTFLNLYERGVSMCNKPFAVGLRVEHKQSLIDESQYHDLAGHPLLGVASYRLTHTASTGKGVYTFCMCPGGQVVGATSLEGHVVTNGMSEHARDLENANSAVLVQVNESDYGTGVLAGMYYQEQLEKQAFVLGGSNGYAPVQRVVDYLNNKESDHFGAVQPTYLPGVKFANLNALFSDVVNQTLKEGLTAFDHKIKGFVSEDAILTAVESRSSSPVRILRDHDYHSVSYFNLYPCGEGAGYAGGIVSSALDGLRCATKIMELYEPFKD